MHLGRCIGAVDLWPGFLGHVDRAAADNGTTTCTGAKFRQSHPDRHVLLLFHVSINRKSAK